MLLFHITIALLIGSAGSVGLAGILLLLKDKKLEKVFTYLISLAGGTLLGAAFLGMLPKAINLAGTEIDILRLSLAAIVAFFTSYPFGVLVTLSVFAHEIPQELADFGVLINNGYSRGKALWYNMLSSLSALPGKIIAYVALDSAKKLIPWALAISAASFIYIALADLGLQMHKKTRIQDSIV